VEPFGTFVHLDGLCRLAPGHVDGVRGADGGGGRIFDVFRPNISEDAHRDAICRRHLVEDGTRTLRLACRNGYLNRFGDTIF
jgi:hypothetical protein